MARTHRNLKYIRCSAGFKHQRHFATLVAETEAADRLRELGYDVANRLAQRANGTGIGNPWDDTPIAALGESKYNAKSTC